MSKIIQIATRGSALALAQANFILNECRRLCPELAFQIKIIKTTGDKLQRASLAHSDEKLPRGLFTKELEDALLQGHADLAVHSLKDLPTILPPGLELGATPEREDVRDVLIYRGSDAPKSRSGPALRLSLKTLRPGAVIGTSSTRRSAQLLELRPDVQIVPLRGNVGTRLQKLAKQGQLDAIILAAAGLSRLNFKIRNGGELAGDAVPHGLRATFLEPEEVLPCVGQAAIGIEIREQDAETHAICSKLNHLPTWQAVTAERAFLRGMGGGCQSPVGAYAEVCRDQIRMRAVSFLGEKAQRIELRNHAEAGQQLGEEIAAILTNHRHCGQAGSR